MDNKYRAPSSDAERKLVDLFAEVLGHSGVGAADHFFELGGSSLSAATLVRRAVDELGAELNVCPAASASP